MAKGKKKSDTTSNGTTLGGLSSFGGAAARPPDLTGYAGAGGGKSVTTKRDTPSSGNRSATATVLTTTLTVKAPVVHNVGRSGDIGGFGASAAERGNTAYNPNDRRTWDWLPENQPPKKPRPPKGPVGRANPTPHQPTFVTVDDVRSTPVREGPLTVKETVALTGARPPEPPPPPRDPNWVPDDPVIAPPPVTVPPPVIVTPQDDPAVPERFRHVNSGFLGGLPVQGTFALPDSGARSVKDVAAYRDMVREAREVPLEDPRCKPRPKDNKPKENARRGKGGGRAFIPWC